LVDAEIYQVSDSMEAIRAAELMEFGPANLIGGKDLQQDNRLWSIPGIVNVLQFNRVEGLALRLPYAAEDKEGTIRRWEAALGYGFLDRRFKGSALGRFEVGGREPAFLTIAAYSGLSTLFRDAQLYSDALISLAAVFDRYDGRDYFYRSGASVQWETHVLPRLEVGMGAGWTDYGSAEKHSDWSLLRKGVYRDNAAVNDGSMLSARISLTGDFRTRMLVAGRVSRPERKPSQLIPTLALEYQRMELDAGSWDLFIPQFSLSNDVDFGVYGTTEYRIEGARATNRLPVQSLLTLRGSEIGLTTPFRFRTADIGEFGGDEHAAVFLDHNFGRLPLLWMGLPKGTFFATEMWELRLFLAAGWTRMRPATRDLLTWDMKEARLPLVEAGIALNRLFGILRLDFGHRITHLGEGGDWFLGISIEE
ncbi:MAG: DUF5686 family protein, partial [Bacteroidota bacterium]|nr:DUF5686 family protein [Bacteroidota bacterium]